MARSFLTAINLNKNELQNAAVQNLGTAPSSPVKGQLYYDSAGNVLYWWNGTVWVAAQGGAGVSYGTITASTTFGQAKADGVATTVARSDHVHGTPAHSAAEHSTIPISALAAATSAVNMGGFVINNVGTPVANTDAVNRGYVDNLVMGLSWKDSVRVASTATVTLSPPTQVIDGVTVAANDRALFKNQTVPATNGIYYYDNSVPAWIRTSDANTGTEVEGMAVFVNEGTTNADTAWVCTTNAPITVDTTALTFVQFAGGGAVTAGAGMTQSGNTLNVIGGTGITVGADLVSLDTTYTDGRYVDVAGDTMTGSLIVGTTGAQQSVKIGGTDGSGNGGTLIVADGTSNRGTVGASGGGLYINSNTTTTIDAPTVTLRSQPGGNSTSLAVSATAVTSTLPVVLPADPSANLQAATKQYVDNKVATGTSGFAKKYTTATIGGATSQVVTHNLATQAVVIDVFRTLTPWDTVECDVERTTTNTATLRFAVAPAANEYTVVVIG